MRIFLITICVAVIQCLAFAQGFKTRHYVANASQNSSKALFESTLNNYVGLGFAVDTSGNVARNQIVLTGLNSNGEVQWVKKHHGGAIEYLENGFIQRCFYKSGNYLYFAGCAQDSDAASGRMFGIFLKYNLNGDTVWRRTFKSSDPLEDVVPQMVTKSTDGGFLMTGFFQHWGNNTNPCLLIKTDSEGNELWRKKIGKGSPNVCDGKAIVQDSLSKKIAIVGYQYVGSSNDIYDHILITDSVGNKKYQGNFCTIGGMATDLIQSNDGKILMVGWQFYSEKIGGTNTARSFACKFDINDPASPVWKINGFDRQAIYNGFTSAVELGNSDILIGGFIDTTIGVLNKPPSNLAPNHLTRLTIIDTTGNIKWNRYYNYKTNDNLTQNYQGLRSLNLSNSGSWLAAIEGFNYPASNPLFFVKYDSTGCDSSLAYCALVNSGVEEFQVSGSGFRVYPNPVNDELYIQHSDGHSENTELIITDVNGKETKKEMLDPEGKINTSDLSPGIYFLQIKQNKELVY
ncbi:MAG: T9SS type A sorting domain-containing protein, partial [Bacteroidia bacterium]|nr:T9SS type A sorting domain-containing protein [Bacteroidia bacterium]